MTQQNRPKPIGTAIVVGEAHRTGVATSQIFADYERDVLLKLLVREKPKFLFLEQSEGHFGSNEDIAKIAEKLGTIVIPLDVAAMKAPLDELVNRLNRPYDKTYQIDSKEARKVDMSAQAVFGVKGRNGRYISNPSDILTTNRERMWQHIITKSLSGKYDEPAAMVNYLDSRSTLEPYENLYGVEVYMQWPEFSSRTKSTAASNKAIVVVGQGHIDARISPLTNLLRESGVEVKTIDMLHDVSLKDRVQLFFEKVSNSLHDLVTRL